MKTRSVAFLCILSVLVALNAQSQIAPNTHVAEAFSGKQIESMSPDRIEYLNYISQYAWEFVDIPEGKLDAGLPYLYRVDNETKLTLNTALNCNELPSFNLLTYRYSIKTERNYYRIEGCDKWLMIKSHKEITDGYNEFRNI